MPRAPKQCAHPDCTTRITGKTFCPTHTNHWTSHGRTESSKVTATGRWKRLRRTILDRDAHTCQIRTPGTCTHTATVVDKIRTPTQGGNPYDPTNLRAACKPCNDHKARTSDRQ